MARFEDCLKFTLIQEGGKANDPYDHGGPTDYGITQRVYDDWRVALGLPQQPVHFIQPPEVNGIYKQEYWNRMKCGLVSAPLDLVLFDTCVNSGTEQTGKFLQRALGIPEQHVDGIVGKDTFAALNQNSIIGGADELWNKVIALRIEFDKMLAMKPGQARFLHTWMNRCAALQAACEAIQKANSS